MPWFVPLVFGASYQPAVRPAQLLMFAGLFQGANTILGSSLRGLGHPGLPALAELTGMIVTAGLLWLLLPTWRILGAAYASLIAYAVVSVVLAVFAFAFGGKGNFILPEGAGNRIAKEILPR